MLAHVSGKKKNLYFLYFLDFTSFRKLGSAGAFGGAIPQGVPCIAKGTYFGLDPFYPFCYSRGLLLERHLRLIRPTPPNPMCVNSQSPKIRKVQKSEKSKNQKNLKNQKKVEKSEITRTVRASTNHSTMGSGDPMVE